MRARFVQSAFVHFRGRGLRVVAETLAAVVFAFAIVGGLSAVASPHQATLQCDAQTAQPDIKTPPQTFAPQPLSTERAAAVAEAMASPARSMSSPMVESQSPEPLAGSSVFDFTSPLFDRAADGSLHALGRNYKARFDSGGFVYIPRFASGAPGTFPLRLMVEAVHVGGEPIAINHASPQQVSGELVRFERGSFFEAYHVHVDSIEQTFTFLQGPAIASGDLIIRLAIETELVGEDVGDQLLFRNNHGTVSYSKAVLVDAGGVRTNLVTNLLPSEGGQQHIEIVAPAALLDSATWPITIDPVIQNTTVDAGVNARVPDAAFDSSTNTWLVTWEVQVSAADGDVLARRTDAQGAPIGSVIVIDATTENWRNPRVANNEMNNNFLVVAERGSAGARTIWGRIVSAADGAASAPFQISDSAVVGEKVNPDVGGDSFVGAPPVHWLVVWERVVNPADHDIHAQLVTSSGATTGAPSGSTILLENSLGTLDINPAVSASNRAFAWPVVWQRDQAQQDDIYGMRVLFNGTIETAVFPVDNTPVDTQRPSVATPFLSTRYVVVYEDAPGVLGDIRARAFDDAAMLSDINLTALEGVSDSLRRGQPSVDASISQVVVAYEQESTPGAHVDAYASSFCWDGSTLTLAEGHRRLADSSDDDARPIIVGASGSNGSEDQFLAVWSQRNLASGSGPIHSAAYRTGTCCPADVNDSSAVDVDDLIAVILDWGPCNTCPGDINGDAQVTADDLIAVILGWGACN